MLELAIIHRPGLRNGQQDLGRILEAMLYYDRVHLIMSAPMFTGLWDLLGPDDFAALLRHPGITTTFTPEMLAIHNQVGTIATHRPVAIKAAGRNGVAIDDKDDVGTLLQLLERVPNRPGATRGQVRKLLNMTKRSRYRKILGGGPESHRRFVSLAKDQETLKLFLRGWAATNGRRLNQSAIEQAQISLIELGEEFMIASTIPLEQMVPEWNPGDTWGVILGSIQDYAVDLYLSQANSADIITTPEVSEVASARVDLSLQRAFVHGEQISAFEEMVFEEAHPFGEAFNCGWISFAEALKVVDQSRRFRIWSRGLAPDAVLIHEYHRAIAKETILQKFPLSLLRFTIFNTAGILADSVMTGAGLLPSAIDTFIVERLVGGWRPNIFVRNMQKTLSKAKEQAFGK